jgi:hypothetical protein
VSRDGHVSAFAFFGGVPLSILYDNTKLAVAKILGDGTRKRTITFSELQSHYLFEDRFGRPGKGNDKGNVEGVIGFGRRNFLVPMPRFESFEALNAWLEEQCLWIGAPRDPRTALMRDPGVSMRTSASAAGCGSKVGVPVRSLSGVRPRADPHIPQKSQLAEDIRYTLAHRARPDQIPR